MLAMLVAGYIARQGSAGQSQEATGAGGLGGMLGGLLGGSGGGAAGGGLGGLASMLDVDGNGNTVPGFQVHLGGSLGVDSGFGRKLRKHKVTDAELGDYIERIVRNFVKQRDQGERFATWAMRADEADLR